MRIVLRAAGTGNPFFTTDTAAVLRASELKGEAVLKATNVDGVYSADPKKDASARRFERLTHQDAIERDLKVMDATAFALARENRIPIIVFSIREPGAIAAVLAGNGRATPVSCAPRPKSLVSAVERAIINANLGLNPATEGQLLRLRIPELNEERRKELVKVAHRYAETARVAVRHVRRDGLDILKKLEKDHKISKDDHDRDTDQVQKATDQAIAEIDHALPANEKEILTV